MTQLVQHRSRWLFAMAAGLVLALIVFAGPLIAQESDAAAKSGFVRFVEGQLSAPNRQISIDGLDGVLSSDVRIKQITIADREGVWLKIVNAHLVWNQGALLGGQLLIDSLEAERIDYIRPALPDNSVKLPSPEAQGLSLPDLPVAVIIKALNVPKVTFGQAVFGLSSDLSVAGSVSLSGGALGAKLDMTRLDGPGGALKLAVAYTPSDKVLALDVHMSEPANGVLANLANIEGRPALSLDLSGQGPITGFDANLSMSANGAVVLSGTSRLTQTATGLQVQSQLGGPIADIVPAAYRAFFGARSDLGVDVILRDGGGIDIRSVTLEGGQVGLSADGQTTPDGFLRRLNLSADIAAAGGEPVVLPLSGGKTKLNGAKLRIAYGDSANWQASLDASSLSGGNWLAQKISLKASGVLSAPNDAQNRRLTFNGDGSVEGLSSHDAKVADAIGDRLDLGFAGLWTPQEGLNIAQLRFLGKAIEADLAGTLRGLNFDGSIAVKSADLAPFSGFAGRQLGGAVDASAKGQIKLGAGGFDLAFSGHGQNLSFGIGTLDPLLVGQTTLSGRLARTATGIAADKLALASNEVRLTANGKFSSQSADLVFSAQLNDLAKVTPNGTGAVTLKGSAKGTDGDVALAITASMPNGTLAQRDVSKLSVGVNGQLQAGLFSGRMQGAGFVGGHNAQLSAGLSYKDGLAALDGLKFDIVGTAVTGGLAQAKGGLWNGKLVVDAPDVSLASALLLAKAEGALNATVALAPEGPSQTAQIVGRTTGLVFNSVHVGQADVSARLSDVFGVPQASGTLNARRVEAGGLSFEALTASARQKGGATLVDADGTLTNGANAALAGTLTPRGKGFSLGVDKLVLNYQGQSARLSAPATLTSTGETLALSKMHMLVGQGSITLEGLAAPALDLSAEVQSVPLDLVNAVRPDLGLSGTVSGSLRATGTSDDPQIDFSLSGSGLAARAIANYGATPLVLRADGRFANGELSLKSAQLTGPRGIFATGAGRIPLVGSNGQLRISGTLPLALADLALAGRGTQFTGDLSVDAVVSGSLLKPRFGGTVSARNAGVTDPFSKFRLTGISADATLSTDQLVLTRLAGDVATGGRISGSGTVGLGSGMPANVQLRLDNVRYADGNLFVATASGDLTLDGLLARDPKLSGALAVSRAEISIPDLGAQSSALLDVTNVHTPPAVRQTIARAQTDLVSTGQATRPSVLQLDVRLTAPNQIFVRGRGLDAELGGSVRIVGPASSVRPVGGFTLIRGRLDILNQRIAFTSGQITLVGDLNPLLDFSAQTDVSGTRIFVTVTGPAAKPVIGFTSSPSLPQDEVLSLLVFKRALSNLSPLQLAQLAGAAATLAGGGNSSLLDGLRAATGLDTLDIVTDQSGNAAIAAGRYIQDNVYVGVQAGTSGKSAVTIDLNLGSNVTAKGTASSDGETSVGVFYEQDY